MDYKLRFSVWERDKGQCQECGKALFEVLDVKAENEKILHSIKEIPIYKWQDKCWKCKRMTTLVNYNLSVGYNYMIGDIPKLDEILSKIFNFVKLTHSQTMGQRYFGNTCVHCGALQGKFFLFNKMVSLICNGDSERYIDKRIKNDLILSDIVPIDREEQFYEKKLPKISEIHHIDKNTNNNEINNLILLCSDCHLGRHGKKRKK